MKKRRYFKPYRPDLDLDGQIKQFFEKLQVRQPRTPALSPECCFHCRLREPIGGRR